MDLPLQTFEDRAISNQPSIDPAWLMMMLLQAKTLTLVSEDADRISRDQGDWHGTQD
jgi:hypothetical protein